MAVLPFGTDQKGFVPFAPEAIVHAVGHYTPSVISAKAAVVIVAEAERNEKHWKEAITVQEEAMIVSEKLSCNAVLYARMKQTLHETCSARKCITGNRLFHAF